METYFVLPHIKLVYSVLIFTFFMLLCLIFFFFFFFFFDILHEGKYFEVFYFCIHWVQKRLFELLDEMFRKTHSWTRSKSAQVLLQFLVTLHPLDERYLNKPTSKQSVGIPSGAVCSCFYKTINSYISSTLNYHQKYWPPGVATSRTKSNYCYKLE